MAFMLEEVAGKEVSITESGESVLTYCYGELVSHFIFSSNLRTEWTGSDGANRGNETKTFARHLFFIWNSER